MPMFSCWGCSYHNPHYDRNSLLYYRELLSTKSDQIWSLSKELYRKDLITLMQLERFDTRLNRISDMWYGRFSEDESEWLLCVDLDVDFGPARIKEIGDLLNMLYDNVKKFDTQ